MASKLLDTMFENMLTASIAFSDARKDVHQLAINVSKLARAVAGLARAVQVHEQSIGELYAVQEQILRAVKTSPAIEVQPKQEKKDKASKPN